MLDIERSHTPIASSADQDLLARLKSGDDRALSDLSDAYSSKIYQLAFRYLRNKEDAEEITQDVLFKVYRKVDAFRGDAQLPSWISITLQRRDVAAAHGAASAGAGGSARRRGGRRGRRRQCRADARRRRLERHGRRARAPHAASSARLPRHPALPAIYRAPVMRDIQGSTEEASAMLKVKDQTLKSRLHRGR